MADLSDPDGATSAPSILSKAFDILDAFTPEVRVLTVTDITSRTGLPKSTVHRLVHRLVELGVLEPHADRGYRIGIRLLHLAARMPISALREVALPRMVRLEAATHCQVQLIGIRSGRMAMVERVIGPDEPVPSNYPVEGKAAWETATGRAIMSRLPVEEVEVLLRDAPPELSTELLTRTLAEIRKSGVVSAWHTSADDTASFIVAAPVLVNRHPVAALCLILDSEQRSPAIDAALRRTALEIGRASEDAIADHEDWHPAAQ